MTGIEQPAEKHLDGADLSALLIKDPTNPELVRTADGSVRDTMVWHFPNSIALESTIRVGDWKLVRNYDHLKNPHAPELELYRMYETKGGQQNRGDIEEAHNLADSMPEKAQALNAKLTEILTEMEASYPYYNPNFKYPLPNKEKVCTIESHTQKGDRVEFSYKENGAKVVRANLLYTLNGGERYEEWFRQPATLAPNLKVFAQLPEGTTHYIINLIDENNFLQSYPEVMDMRGNAQGKNPYSTVALLAE